MQSPTIESLYPPRQNLTMKLLHAQLQAQDRPARVASPAPDCTSLLGDYDMQILDELLPPGAQSSWADKIGRLCMRRIVDHPDHLNPDFLYQYLRWVHARVEMVAHEGDPKVSQGIARDIVQVNKTYLAQIEADV